VREQTSVPAPRTAAAWAANAQSFLNFEGLCNAFSATLVGSIKPDFLQTARNSDMYSGRHVVFGQKTMQALRSLGTSVMSSLRDGVVSLDRAGHDGRDRSPPLIDG